MKKISNRWPFYSAIAGISLCMASPSYAQIGPELMPPGLSPDHPVNSYTVDGKKSSSDDWRHEVGWELNASDIVFSAAKKRQLISEAPSTIHVITDRDIAAHGWRTLAEILRFVPGVQTQTTNSRFQSVMIRGLVGSENNNSRILWLQNGVPMNDVRDSGIWLDETYPIEMIKRIEVVLGPGSALYGSGAFQGVVNIFTKDAADINKYGEYRVSISNNLTFNASAIAAYNSPKKDLGFLAHVSGNTTQGPGLLGSYMYEEYSLVQGGANVGAGKAADSLYYSHIGSNSDKHWYNIDLKFNYKKFKIDMGFTDIYAGADGSEYLNYITLNQNRINSMTNSKTAETSEIYDKKVPTNPDYRFNRREFHTDLMYEAEFGDSVSFLSVISYRMNQYRFKNFNGFSNLYDIEQTSNSEGKDVDKPQKYFNTNFDSLQQKLYALAQVQWRIYEANELIGGVVLEYHNIDAGNEFNGGKKSEDRRNYNKIDYLTPSIFLQDEQRFWDDRIILTLGGRLDVYKSTMDERDIAPSWRFAFLGKWTDWMTMRLSYGYSFKEPSLYQLYSSNIDYEGEPDLNPEKLHNVELSFLFTPLYFMKIRLDGFASWISDLIVVNYNTDLGDKAHGIEGRYTPKQDGDAQIYGFELSLDSAIGQNWNIYTHYNFLYLTGDKDLNSGDAMHRFKLGATFMNDWVTADVAAFLVGGSQKITSAFEHRGRYAVPFYAILQPQVTAHVGANIGVMVQGSYAFSEGMLDSPTNRFYYEKEGIPVNRYSVMLSLIYPFRSN